MSKLPAFQFYPGDWRKDMGVQSLNFHDRGVWWEMLCLMHESEQRGKLLLNGVAMGEESLARLLGLDKQILTTTLTTLLTSGVASRDDVSGAIICRRMVRDEHIRKVRSEAGSKGGNPALLNQNTTTEDKQISTPSSSVSTSDSNIRPKTKPLRRDKPDADERTEFFREDFKRAFEYANNVPAPWSAKEATNLRNWLIANPTISREQWQGILRNRHRSPVNKAAPLSMWIGRALSWLNGTADEQGRPIQGGHQNGKGTYEKPTTAERQALELQRSIRDFGTTARADQDGCGALGDGSGSGDTVADPGSMGSDAW